ncbi:hypothetical protein [Exiguobacterium sp. s5]|uniref:phage protein n=1 Tax=Exiguobacterium sp. s5 TaxID=2751239 RepID=UPI001BE84F37|nr:hypothetical protein [Exiguobacterium sp. s5]
MSSRQLFGRVKRVKISGGSFNGTYTNEGDDGLEIRFEVPFDDDPKPNETKIEIFNLSRDSVAKIKRGSSCTLEAGYKGDVGVLASGKIARALTRREGVDKITTIYIIEGEDFSRVKVNAASADPAGKGKKQKIQISFKPGTKGDVIIKKLVAVLGIKLAAPPKLKKNKEYKKGYVVTGQVLNNLEEVIRDCGSVMYHRRGKLVIRPLDEGTDERFELSDDTGMIGSPEPFEEDGIRGYKGSCLLQHRITTGSDIRIKSRTANGKYRARKGRHIADGNSFHTEFEVV